MIDSSIAKKRCPKCKTVKDVSEFHRKASTRDGLHSHCKLCMRQSKMALATRYRENELTPLEKRCTGCSDLKPIDDFAKNRTTKDGRSEWCARCRQVSSKQRSEFLRNQNPEGQRLVTEKRCPSCRETKSASEFYRSKTRYDGLKQFCRKCEGVKRKSRILTPESRKRTRTRERERNKRPDVRQKRRAHRRVYDREYKKTPIARATAKRYRTKHREAILKRERTRRATEAGKQQKREYYQSVSQSPSFKDKSRDARYKKLFGITLADYNAMFAAQGGKCAICRKESTKRHLSVDHDHVTGAVRSLLCAGCNQALGLFRDDPDILVAATQYLLKHRELKLVV